MIAEVASFPMSDQILEKIGNVIKNKYQRTQLINAVVKIEKEYKQQVFDNLSQQEEFDWTGLEKYIDDNLLSKILSVFLLPNKEIRDMLHGQIYILAYSSAKADTIAKQRQVSHLMDKVLLQVGNYLCEKQEPSEWMPFNEVTDQVCARFDAWGEGIKEEIAQQTQILEGRFKELHESLKYQNSFAKIVDDTKLPEHINSLFNYRDPKVGFYGREREITFLDGFLDCEEPILFTAVTGPAGSGKSKFLYEYVKSLESNPNWKCLFIQNRKFMKGLNERYEWEYPVNLLVVIDYAGDYADLIGEWLVSLKAGKCPPKLRIVLLEREGVGKNRSDNKIQEKVFINPMWYERLLTVHSNDDIKTMLYTTGKDTMFLELPTLSDDAFKHIMSDYANEKEKVLSECEQEEILEYCKKIEKSEQGVCRPRPLILLFIVDAWVNEEKYHRWNIQQLLLQIIKRYKEHWESTLCGGNKNVFMSLERLMIYATAIGGWEIRKPLPEFLQKDYFTLRDFCMTPQKLNQLFRSANEKFEWDNILSPLEPDLIGELFVLDYLKNTFESEHMIEAFSANSKYLLFLFRSIVDYADVDKYADMFDHGLKLLLNESLINELPELYASLLVILMDKQNEENAIVTLEYLKELALNSRYAGKEEIVLSYAKGLFILAAKQEVKEAEKTVEGLGEIAGASRYAGNEEIVLMYAGSLINLTNKQEEKEAEKTVERLRKLSEDSRYAGNEEIVLIYVKGLFNLALKQEEKEAEKTVERLRKLSEDSRYAGNEEIVLTYAEGLFNLVYGQEEKEAEKTVERLGEIASDSRYAGNEEIVLCYVESLVNLTNKQEEKEAEKTVERLGELANDSRYAGNEEIVLTYAKGLVNVVAKQEAEEAGKTLGRLRELASDSRYAGNEEIVLEYAMGLFSLAYDQEVKEAEKALERLREIASDSRYAGNEEIVLEYAMGLVNLANKQEVKEAEKTVERLRELASDSRYAGNEQIVLTYAKGLFNLAYDQKVKEAEKTVERLRELASDSRYAGNEEIVLEYAESLFNLGYKYYSEDNFEMAEYYFTKAHQMGCENGSINLSYMIRRRETKTHSPDEIKEVLLPVLDDDDSFAIMNMALYLAEYEDDWSGADNLLSNSVETADFSGAIGWWSELDDLEGLLVMTWLERHKICTPCHTVKGKRTLELLRSKYLHIPDWILEIRTEG